MKSDNHLTNSIMIKYLMIIFICLGACKGSNHNEKKVLIEKQEDSLKSATIFKLKGNYKLILYRTKEKYGDYLNYNITGNGVNIQIAYGDPDFPSYTYENIDFDNYFVMTQSGGGNYSIYFFLFDKKTGERILTGHEGTYDIKNNLILYSDDDDDSGEMTLYNVETKKKQKVKIPKKIDKPCFNCMGFYTNYHILKVDKKFIYLKYSGCEKPQFFKIKIDK